MKKFKRLFVAVAMSLVAATTVSFASCDLLNSFLGNGDNSSSAPSGHTHELTKVEKVDATCTEAGTEAYWTCGGCEGIFADANGNVKLDAPKAIAAKGHSYVMEYGTEADCTTPGTEDHYTCKNCDQLFDMNKNPIDAPVTTNPSDHKLTKTEAKDATCTEDGNVAYWTCGACKKVFSDAEGKNEITLADTVVESDGHDATKTEAKDPTCDADGNYEYWTCGDCGKIYEDEACTKEISLVDTVIPTMGHQYSPILEVEGEKTVYEPGEVFDTTNLVVKLACVNCDYKEEVEGYTISKTDPLETTDTKIYISYVGGRLTYTAQIAITVVHVHTAGELVEAKAPTCSVAGNVAYYACTECGVKFEDAAATKPIENVVVPATGHAVKATKTDAVDATCSTAGNYEYWTCGDCGKVFSDEACTKETTVEDMQIATLDHDLEVKSDDEGHWYECVNCDYVDATKADHVGIPYPDAKPVCNVCGVEFGEATTDGWVLFRPGVVEVTNFASSASHVTVDGIMASQYVFQPASAGAESTIWTMSDRHAYKADKYQVRIPTISSEARAVYVCVSSTAAVSFRMYSENYGDKGGADITLAAGETKIVKYSVNTGNTVGSNINFQLLSELAETATVTIYGYFYLPEAQITNLAVANPGDLNLSYKVGEKLDLSNLILSANIIQNADGDLLSDGSVEDFYIENNYKLSVENGYEFTEDDLGKKTVVVSFNGHEVELTVNVSGHTHDVQYVAYKAASCTEDGNNAHYACVVDGCGQLFADEEGKTPIEASSVIIAKGHVSVQLPGTVEYCARCNEALGEEVMDGEHWVLFRPEINVGDGSFAGWNAEYADVDGVYGSKFTFGAGVNAGDRIKLTMWNEQGNFQTIIPNVVDTNVATRNVVMYYHNYGVEAITLKFQNDSNSESCSEVTIPAGGYVVDTFINKVGGAGSNWFYLQVKNDIQSDVTVGVYGYFYLDAEINSISILNKATKLSFAEGETFTAAGLMLKTSGGIKAAFIETGYTTDLDGYVFTAEDIGTKTVTVTFAGKTVSYEVEVTAHKHVLEYVAQEDPIKCEQDGVEAYYKCTVAGCDELFADENGNVKIDAPVAISCHKAGLTVPGTALVCVDCNQTYGVKSMENWVFYNVTTSIDSNTVVNGKLEVAEVEGKTGTLIHVGAGTTAGSHIKLKMGDNDAGKQTVIPNLGSNAPDGAVRNVILFYKNYGAIDVTLNLQNDANGGNGSVTIPANGTAICEFAITNKGGSNWFFLFVDSDVTEDVTIGVYGYIYANEGEVETITVNKAAEKTTFKVGETFSAAGLVVDARIPSSNTKTLYAQTGYTTNFDGVTFTADQVGEQTVVVTFAGVTTTYTINVEA